MRTSGKCPTCNMYLDATCIIYSGETLSAIGAAPTDNLTEILAKINDAIPAITGTGSPNTIPQYIGQLYIDTLNSELWVGLADDTANWGLVGEISTTTTTSSSTTTTTTTLP